MKVLPTSILHLVLRVIKQRIYELCVMHMGDTGICKNLGGNTTNKATLESNV